MSDRKGFSDFDDDFLDLSIGGEVDPQPEPARKKAAVNRRTVTSDSEGRRPSQTRTSSGTAKRRTDSSSHTRRSTDASGRPVKKSGTSGKRTSTSGKSSAASRNAKRRQRRKRAIILRAIIVAAIILLALLIGIIVFAKSKLSKIKTESLDADALSISDELSYDETGYLNVALFGVDEREDDGTEGSRSDTIMVVSLNRETKEVRICSILRDSYLQIDDSGQFNKMNASYSYGTEQQAISTLNRNLDLNIEQYVTVNMNAMVEIVDALGGVEVDVQEDEVEYLNDYAYAVADSVGKELYYTCSGPGVQYLDGILATAYCRIRYTDGDDFRRTERQRTVIEEIVKNAKKADLLTLNTIIDKVFPMIKTNFSMVEILAYAKDITKYNIGETAAFPNEYASKELDIGSVIVPVTLESNAIWLHNFFNNFGESTYEPSSTVQSISATIASTTGYYDLDQIFASESTGYTDTGYYDDSYYYDDSAYYDESAYYDDSASY